MSTETSATDTLATYRVPLMPLYVVGSFESGVTVYSQQVRALNLAWALVETGNIACRARGKRKNVAIIGAGFSGLTLAAALLAKDVNADLTIYERRDTLLPLQHGSESRWLHPRIYDWPAVGSDAPVSMLPILNWSSARASDVVVQILSNWRKFLIGRDSSVKLFCNTRHLHVSVPTDGKERLAIEWVGERREPASGNGSSDHPERLGGSQDFDAVVLTAGFGLERDGAISYWRNENLAQPSLDKPFRTYVLSGQGDGALIDLMRLRISRYRQDRVLSELFDGKPTRHEVIRKLNDVYISSKLNISLFNKLEELLIDNKTKDEFANLLSDLSLRLRRDTQVIWHIRKPHLANLFNAKEVKMSFQNRFLGFSLYKCGGFIPSCDSI